MNNNKFKNKLFLAFLVSVFLMCFSLTGQTTQNSTSTPTLNNITTSQKSPTTTTSVDSSNNIRQEQQNSQSLQNQQNQQDTTQNKIDEQQPLENTDRNEDSSKQVTGNTSASNSTLEQSAGDTLQTTTDTTNGSVTTQGQQKNNTTGTKTNTTKGKVTSTNKAVQNKSAQSQSHLSTQPHQKTITSLLPIADGSFFSVGEDGFVIRWTHDGIGEHYQVTDLKVKKIALHPNGKHVAIYETDGYSVHRVSMWDWSTLTRTFVKTLNSEVTALDFTAKGSYLAIGTSSVDGLIMVNPSNGQTIPNKIKQYTGIVTMFTSSSTEKSAVMYSPTGNILYYDLLKGTLKTKITTETNLTDVGTFLNNRLLVGLKNNLLYIIDATNGQTLKRLDAKNAHIYTTESSSVLYFSVPSGSSYVIKSAQIVTEDNKLVIQNTVNLKTITGINRSDTVTDFILQGSVAYLSTDTGNIYQASLETADSAVTATQITEKAYSFITDMAVIGNDFYFLTANELIKTSYRNQDYQVIYKNKDFTHITVYQNNLLLWTKGKKNPVYLFDCNSGETTKLFTPQYSLERVMVYKDTILYLDGNVQVKSYNLAEDKVTTIYSGTGIQDAVLVDDYIYVSKSSSSNPPCPVISVNIRTKETVMLPVDGLVGFNMAIDSTYANKTVTGIVTTDKDNKINTLLYSYDTAAKKNTPLFIISEEDINAYVYTYGATIYTNLGKNAFFSYNRSTKKQIVYKRSSSLPVKLVRNNTQIAVLNKDGSISWYGTSNGSILATWYATTNGTWIEF